MSRLDALLEAGNALAIVGMAGRFPGARDIRRYWQNLRGGVESLQPLSAEDLRARGVPEALLADPAYVRVAAILDGMDHFDAGFFGFSPKDAAILDPQHRHLLEVAWEALEDAGHPPERFPGPIGVFAGSGANAYLWANLMTHPELVREVGFFLLRHTGNDKDFLTTRVSYLLNLTGPSVNVQTACSTSLVAVHLAAQSLLLGECDLALAGGVTIEQPHGVGYLFREREILSPDGRCRPFDAAAAGTVFGSAAGLVVLRRLADAVADGDQIRAVLLGSAINNDGSLKVGYLAPSVDGQARAIAEALGVADVLPASLGYVEAHGTGTAVGDPIEVAALTQAFRADAGDAPAPGARCVLGSVKANIGHADTAAGVAGLIKAVAALEAGEIPPTLHFEAPNPALGLAETPFDISNTLRPWPGRGPRRAGVSSLGVGGTNAFVVLEEAPARASAPPPRRLHLLPLSGRSERVREVASADLAGCLEDGPDTPEALADTAWTLSVGRRAFPFRRAVVAASAAEAAEALLSGDATRISSGEAKGPAPELAFLFAGGGAQHPGMAAALYAAEPVYRAVIDDGLARLDADLRDPVRRLLLDDGDADGAAEAQRPSRALPALLLAQLAQARLWISWGIRPAALLGHSMGEYTAACLAEVLSPGDALRIVTARGRLFEAVPEGGMLAVPLAAEALRARLPDGLSIAAVNGPELCVAAGPPDRLAALEAELAADQIEGRRIRIAVAAHSHMLDGILEPFRQAFEGLRLGAPRLPIASNLTGEWLTPAQAADPDYWVRHLRETVQFAGGLRRVIRDQPRILLEVGPGQTLATLARGGVSPAEAPAILASMGRAGQGTDGLQAQLGALARLWTLGVEPDWPAFFGPGQRLRRALPTYPFEHQRYFIAPGQGLPFQASAPQAAPERDPADPGSSTPAPAPPGSGAPAPAALPRDPQAGWLWGHRFAPAPLPAPLPEPPAEAPAGPLLLVGTEALPRDLVTALAAALEALGHPARPTPAATLPAALSALRDQAQRPAGVVWLDLLASDLPASPADDPTLAQAQDRAFFGPLAALQALGAALDEAPLPFLVPAVALAPVEPTEPVAPWKSLALGPVRTAPRELPGLWARAIDLPAAEATDPTSLAARLVSELGDEAARPLVAWRAGQRLAQGFERLPLPPAPARALPIGPDQAWLITGGLGGLGLAFAEGLVAAGARHLVLVSRGGLPPRPRWEAWLSARPAADRVSQGIRAVRALEAAGASVELAGADVADPVVLGAALAARPPGAAPIGGVIHAAGVLDDGPLLACAPARAARVLAPTVAGALALRAALADQPVQIELHCSSRSAISGVPGQVDYTAANAFLDAWASAPARAGLRTVAVEWDVWRETGMAHGLGQGAPGRPPAVGSPDAAGAGRPLDHPLLWERRGGPEGEAFYLTAFSAGAHWMLDEHRLAGGARLIPGAGFLELLRAALAAETGAATLDLRDVLFLEPFLVPEDVTRELAIRLRPDDDGFALAILGRATAETRWTTHVTGRAAPAPAAAPPPKTSAEPPPPGPLRAPEGGGLSLGPRWHSLERLQRDSSIQANLWLSLPQAFHADLAEHPLHPALLDVATAGAQQLIPGFDPRRAFYIPASYGRLSLRAPLPARLRSEVRLRRDALEGSVAFDVRLFDLAGQPLAEIDEFVMIRVDASEQLQQARPAAPQTPEAQPPPAPLAEGIDTAGGVAALLRILRDPGLPPVVAVVPRDLEALLQALDQAAQGPAKAPVEPERPEIEALVEVLRQHPAVLDAAAVAHPWGAGELHAVAFVQYAPTGQPTVSELRRFVRAQRPDGLIPRSVVEVSEIPRDAQGRLDRSRVDDPLAPRDTHVAPRTPTERLLASIWARLLGLERVSLHDNFLDVGGHSLVGIRVLLQVERETGVRLHPNALTLQTLEQLAAECDRQREPPPEPPPEAGPGRQGLKGRFLTAVRQMVGRPPER